MNKERLAGNWMQIRGKVKQKWGKLTDDDLLLIKGKKDVLVGKLVERYGVVKQEAEGWVDDFVAKLPKIG